MYKKAKLHKKASVMILALLLTACTQQEIIEEQTFSSDTAESNIDVEEVENDPDIQQNVTADILNKDILAVSAGATVTQTIENSAGEVISIDAQVDVAGVTRVSYYRYIPWQFTEDGRKALFKEMFPAEGWDVNEAAVYNEKEDVWEILTPIEESWIYQVGVSEIPNEQIVNLERVDKKPDYTKESKVSSVRITDRLSMEEYNFLKEIPGCVPVSVEQRGQEAIEIMTGIDTYSCNYLHICEDSGGYMYAKAVFKQIVDGMPVTVWHNFSTVTTGNNGSIPAKEWGSLFSLEEIGLDKPILTPTEAVAAMQEQIDVLRIQETQMYIKKISLEYLAVISSSGTLEVVPIWRFWPGNDEIERSMMCEQILAVNAVSGELIWESRGIFAE